MGDHTLPTVVPYIDIGQIIISILLGLVGIVGWFIKNQLTNIITRLDKHDDQITNILVTIAKLTGIIGVRASHRKIDSQDSMELDI